ncbi:MAG: hypothetical protein US63_C0008G0013 [Candidatus Moranbacteria bacterium GW2011_GWC2_37_8]|nr:MAG: hypothetical protein US63_C0008G0013 [Candidatus Moranbacteria bacterium GW2011_GWC2_37_8]KKQ62394.1 MAG: hypothetical protein US82_C0012G0012 [Parcubacteria group bacterium GW2011_GWC1_38_22]
MNTTQEKLLKLAEIRDLGKLSYWEIARLIGVKNAQTVKHHLEQLDKKGLIKLNKKEGIVELIKRGLSKGAGIISIPILGSADCGPAMKLAEDEYVQGHIRVSSTLVSYREGMFAIQTDGYSMNNARIGKLKKSVEPGDYVIVDGTKKIPENGDYVLSIIDGLANIKKFYLDEDNQQIVLASESTKNYPPIHIGMDEIDTYVVSGQVIDVIKKPKI